MIEQNDSRNTKTNACHGLGMLAVAALLIVTASVQGAGSEAEKALKQAAAQGKFTYLLFYKDKDDAVKAMQSVVNTVVTELGARAVKAEVAVQAEGDKGLVDKFRVQGAPMPLVLVIAPNGAVTGSAVGTGKSETLKAAIVGPRAAECLKLLQTGKLVLVCVQNAQSKAAKEAIKGVDAFKAEEKIKAFTASVTIDPEDAAEKEFLVQLGIDSKLETATTVVIAPPGRIIGAYSGAVDPEKLFADLGRAMSGGGCGSGSGCGSGCGGKRGCK